MWILKWLPDWIFYAIFLVGLIGYAATYLFKYIPIPFIFVYRKPIQIASVLAIIFGTFMSGAIYDNEAWLDRVKEMEAKVAKAEQEAPLMLECQELLRKWELQDPETQYTRFMVIGTK